MEFRDRGPHESLAPWFVPQLFLEMHCAGSACRGAVVVSTSATRGAIVFRVARDPAYEVAMLALLDDFYARFRDEDPSPCFNADRPGFEDFVRRTGEIAANATVLDRLNRIQCAQDERGPFL